MTLPSMSRSMSARAPGRDDALLDVPARYRSLRDRTVLVTGGASGIGASLVAHFTAQHARVAFIDIDRERGRALARRWSSSAHPPCFVECDLTDIDALHRALAEVRHQCGPIGILLNNAANDARHPLTTVTSHSWDAGIAVNLKHAFFAAQAVIGDMKQLGGGVIVNLGSTSWMLKQAGMPIYTTAKSAMQGLTRSLARELGPFNIRVNTLVPGWVMTEKQRTEHVDAAAQADIDRGQCLPHPLLPCDIAACALFLAADDSRMCTGQDLIIDGGWT